MDLDLNWAGLIIRTGIIVVGLIIAFLVIIFRRRRQRPVARLIVEDSEAASLVNKEFLVKSYPVTLGRARENDISFYQDESVSRYHARLECIEGKIILKEVLIRDANGKIRGPTNGTFVNEQPITLEGSSLEISSGSKIRLGSRLILRFDEVVIPFDGYIGTRRDIQIPDDIIHDQDTRK
jgi:hypothetical protein